MRTRLGSKLRGKLWFSRRVNGNLLSLVLSAILGIGLAVWVIHALDGSVRPVLTEMARAKVTNAVTQIVDEAVAGTLEEDGATYRDMVELQTDASGQITALTSDSAQLNRLRNEILETIITQVDLLDSEELGVPLGNLTEFSIFSDWGPVVPVQVLSVATAKAEFRNQFSDAGINQTRHQIMLDVTVDVVLLIPGGTEQVRVESSICTAETVIIGRVPDTYLTYGGS